MRDPDRILIIVMKFSTLWQRHPDMRFGQLVEYVRCVKDTASVFYIEDDTFEELLDKRLKEGFK